MLVLPGLLLLALPVLWGVAAEAGEMLILGRLSIGEGFSASVDTVLSSAVFDELGPPPDGVSVLGELAAGVTEPEPPPSFASLRRRICSIVSWSGASGVDDDGGGCSVGSIFSVVDVDTLEDRLSRGESSEERKFRRSQGPIRPKRTVTNVCLGPQV